MRISSNRFFRSILFLCHPFIDGYDTHLCCGGRGCVVEIPYRPVLWRFFGLRGAIFHILFRLYGGDDATRISIKTQRNYDNSLLNAPLTSIVVPSPCIFTVCELRCYAASGPQSIFFHSENCDERKVIEAKKRRKTLPRREKEASLCWSERGLPKRSQFRVKRARTIIF